MSDSATPSEVPADTGPTPPAEPSGKRRSAQWFGERGRSGMTYRSWMRNQGFASDVFDGRPVIGIATHLVGARAVQRPPARGSPRRSSAACGRPGGFPLVFPAMATGETLMRPTAMLYRNLMAMEVEELIRANPLDGVVLLSGCDKTTPALLMAAASVDLPAIMVTGGPMLNGKFRGQDVGSGTHVWKFEAEVKAGRMTEEDCFFAEGCMARSNGHCMTMGTASTMACMAEALGMQLPGPATWPAVDARRYARSQEAGRRIVAMVEEDLTPSAIMTRDGVRERDPGQRRDRRLHQRDHPPAPRSPAGSASRSSWTTSTRWSPTCPRWSNLMPSRQVPDGGLLLRGRPAGRAQADARRRAAARRCGDRHRAASSARTSPTRSAGTTT